MSSVFTPSTPEQVKTFITTHIDLLKKECEVEASETSLLLSKCPPKLLEQRGLALGGLGVVGVNIGLGGKSLVELDRPAAYHVSPIFPPHTFRPGDLAQILPHTTGTTSTSKSKKGPSNDGDAESKDPVEGVVYKVSETKIVLAVGGKDGGKDKELDLPERCRIIKVANTVTYDRMEKTLNSLLRLLFPSSSTTPSPSDPTSLITPPNALISTLLNLSQPSLDQPDYSSEEGKLGFLDERLNESQKEAVRFALREAREVALVHGPPGTGKTQTLVEIIRQLVGEDKRVLVCGASNLAVDNLVERLTLHSVPLTRLGHPARILESLHSATLDYQTSHSSAGVIVKEMKEEMEEKFKKLREGKGRGGEGKAGAAGSRGGSGSGAGKGRMSGKERREMWEEVKELRKEYRKREGTVVKNVIGQSKVVLATCHGAGSRQIQDMTFDVAVIDEAAQALEAVCWIPILKAKKLILAGDHLQLPPTIKSLNEKKEKKKPSPPDATAKKKKKDAKPDGKTEGKEGKRADGPKDGKKGGGDDNDGRGKEVADEAGSVSDGTEAEVRALPKTQPASKRSVTLQPPPSLSVTLFDRLLSLYSPKTIKRTLTTQYRMNEKIMRFPSDTLYDGKLIADDGVKDRVLRDLTGDADGKGTEPEAVGDEDEDVLDEPVVFIDTAGADMYERSDSDSSNTILDTDSKLNENEATLVISHINKLISLGIPEESIAIISPYNGQVGLLSLELRDRFPGLEIGSVDGFQGREKDAVIVSLVRSNEDRDVGFLKESRRLNVAMTRPRRHLCIVGDSSTVSEGSSYLKKWMTWLEENADVRMGGMMEGQ